MHIHPLLRVPLEQGSIHYPCASEAETNLLRRIQWNLRRIRDSGIPVCADEVKALMKCERELSHETVRL